jgi:hypothetical protein
VKSQLAARACGIRRQADLVLHFAAHETKLGLEPAEGDLDTRQSNARTRGCCYTSRIPARAVWTIVETRDEACMVNQGTERSNDVEQIPSDD